MRYYTFIIILLLSSLRVAAQDKILVAGSGNSRILLIDKQTGKVEWQHPLEKGEECNTVALTRQGDILYSYKKGAKVVTWNHRVVWDYRAPEQSELQSATLLHNGRILLGICGNPARFVEVDKKGRKVSEITLPLRIEKPHSQFRQVFELHNGNYLVPVMAKQKIMEVSRKGEVMGEYKIDGKAFSSLELQDGNLLLPCGDGHYYLIVERGTGKELKRVTSEDIDGASLWFVAQVLELENKNLLICNWGGHTKGAMLNEPQLIEVDPNGKVVWTLNNKQEIGNVSAAYYLKDFSLPLSVCY